MKALGLDTSEEELRLEHLEKFYKAVLQVYGPLVGKAPKKASELE